MAEKATGTRIRRTVEGGAGGEARAGDGWRRRQRGARAGWEAETAARSCCLQVFSFFSPDAVVQLCGMASDQRDATASVCQKDAVSPL